MVRIVNHLGQEIELNGIIKIYDPAEGKGWSAQFSAGCLKDMISDYIKKSDNSFELPILNESKIPES